MSSVFGVRGIKGVVGQIGNLRPIANRPGTGPPKPLGARCQSGAHRIHFDIRRNPFKLRPVANQPIVTLVLPKGLAGASEHKIGLSSGESLERLHKRGNSRVRSNEHMNMVWHDNIGVQPNAEVQRTASSGIEQTIHGDEDFPDVVFAGNARFRGRLPLSLHVRKIGWPVRE